MSLIPKHYIDSVVSIGTRREDETIAWIGTGFFVHRSINENTVLPFMVSNKHVLKLMCVYTIPEAVNQDAK